MQQGTLSLSLSFLDHTVYLKGESDGKFTFYLSLFKKSPGHH